jgi:hypothetical protein
VFFRAGTLVAQPFDLDRLELAGTAVPIVEQVQIAGSGRDQPPARTASRRRGARVSDRDSDALGARMVQPDRDRAVEARRSDRLWGRLAVARWPAGGRERRRPIERTRALWLFDLARGIRERFTFGSGDDFAPIWSRLDGRYIVFSSRRHGSIHLYEKPATGGGSEEILLEDSLGKFAGDWSPDGKFIVYAGSGIVRGDIWTLSCGSKALHSGDRDGRDAWSVFAGRAVDRVLSGPLGRVAGLRLAVSGPGETLRVSTRRRVAPAARWQEIFILRPTTRLLP